MAHSVGQSLKSFFLKKFCQVDDLLLILTLDNVLDPLGDFIFWAKGSVSLISSLKSVFKIILKILAPISKKYPWTPFPFISKGLYFSGSLSFILWKIESTSIASSNSIRSRSTFLPFLDQAGLLNSVGSSQS